MFWCNLVICGLGSWRAAVFVKLQVDKQDSFFFTDGRNDSHSCWVLPAQLKLPSAREQGEDVYVQFSHHQSVCSTQKRIS